MLFLIFYLFIVLAELIFASFFLVYTISLLYSSMKGSPYVSTRTKEADLLLKESSLKKNAHFLELGCGDGRVVRHAVRDYKVKGLGIDVNPLLVFAARMITKFKKIQNLEFKTSNIFDEKITGDLKKADYIYLFLMPKLIERLSPILEKKCKKGAVIISHGFIIEDWKKREFKKLTRNPFPTYYYKL